MAFNVIIDDYVTRKRSSILFSEDHMQAIIDSWEEESELLLALDDIEMFSGKSRWCDLGTEHFRILITNIIRKRDMEIPQSSHYDDQEPIVQTLYFMILGLVHNLQEKTDMVVDSLNIMRVDDIEVTFKASITMIPEGRLEDDEPKGGLSVVVDNTK